MMKGNSKINYNTILIKSIKINSVILFSDRHIQKKATIQVCTEMGRRDMKVYMSTDI